MAANGELFEKTERFRRTLERGDAKLARTLVKAYGQSFEKVQARLARIQKQVDAVLASGKRPSKGLITRLWREQDMERVIAREITRYSAVAGDILTAEQKNLAALAQRHAGQLVDASLPPGIDRKVLGRAGLGWNEVPVRAVEGLIGALGDGTPLAATLEGMGSPVAQGVKQILIEGAIRGFGPAKMGRSIQNAYGIGLTRSLTIARTETLRAYREGSRAAYAANPRLVKGYRRHASNDDRTCIGCLSADGEF